MSKRFIISGGGTGGHVFPAIAIADALKKRMPDAEFLFVGAQGKMEMDRVPKAGYVIKGLWISGFHRQLTLRNLAFPFKLISSMWKARKLVKSFKPDVAIGTGGYASGPTLRAAGNLRIPTVIQEQNSYAGVTNKLLAKKAHKICVAYDSMDAFFPSGKLVVTGNPVRKDITEISGKRDEAFRHFGFDSQRPTLFIVGGSLGARTLNESMKSAIELLRNRPDVQVLWQCGKLYKEEFSSYDISKLPNVNMTDFIDRMDLAYAMSDVIISRAGAISISELCLVGKPTILVPSPNVAEDHQTKNALALVGKEAAVLVKDKDATKDLLPTAIGLLEDIPLREKLSGQIRKLGKPDAADHIAEEIIGLIKNYTRS